MDNDKDKVPPFDRVGTNTPPVQTTPPAQTTPKDPTALATERLAGAGGARVKEETQSAEPVAFDLSKLTTDQLQQLKSMLNATPDSAKRKTKNPTCSLKLLNGLVIVDMQNAFRGLVNNETLQKKEEKTMIRVKVEGKDEWHLMVYNEFMNLPKITCEIIGKEQFDESYVEGEVVSRETGRLVEMLVKRTREVFKIKLPKDMDERVISVEGKMANS